MGIIKAVPSVSNRLSMERDNANRESQEKETKILNQTRELDELRDRLEEVERLRTTHRDLISSKDDAGKRVSVNKDISLTVQHIASNI